MFCPILSVVYALFQLCAPAESIRRQQDVSYNYNIYNHGALLIYDGQSWKMVQGGLKVFFHRGTGVTTVINRYLGVPYGAPPVGTRRFSAPEPYPNWKGVLNTVDYRPRCLQSVGGTNYGQSEDCLYLNIYSPSVWQKNPVMVWFHGGGFKVGSANDFDGSSLAAHGVVVVTVNYRLGALGFLSTGDDVMPGNYGLLDQVLALKWVKENIHAFGGDPEQVTIFGESSGAANVALHVLSPLSKGLFHRAIMQSGSSLSPWAVERPATLVKIETFTRQVGLRVGCPNVNDSVALVDCLRNISADSLLSASQTLSREFNIDLLLTPRVETKFGFLPDFPERLLENGNFNNVSTLRGFNSGEYSRYVRDPEDDGVSRAEFHQIYSNIFAKCSFEPDVRQAVVEFADKGYLGFNANQFTIRSNLVNAMSDTFFAVPTVVEIDKTVANGNASSNHFLYQLSYRVRSPSNPRSAIPEWQGVLHTEDLSFVFADPSRVWHKQDDPADNAVRERIQTMWTNFAKYGNPVATAVKGEFGVPIRWTKYTQASPELLNIDLPSRMMPFPRPANVRLYDQLLDVFGREGSTNNTNARNRFSTDVG